jgi:AraC-like DNA-binding protein
MSQHHVTASSSDNIQSTRGQSVTQGHDRRVAGAALRSGLAPRAGSSAPAPSGPPGTRRYRPFHLRRQAPRPPLPRELESRARRSAPSAPCRDRLDDKPPYMALSRTTDQVLRILLDGDLSRLRAETVAEQLDISPTTLRRRLRNDHTSYQFLLDRARQYRCEQLLRERWLPGKCLASLLGYVEGNSFYRAFKRWTGSSFSAYKREQQH